MVGPWPVLGLINNRTGPGHRKQPKGEVEKPGLGGEKLGVMVPFSLL